MKLEHAKVLAEAGAIEDAVIFPLPPEYGPKYGVELITAEGGNAHPDLEAARGGPRRFATIDAAWSVCRSLGLKAARVEHVTYNPGKIPG